VAGDDRDGWRDEGQSRCALEQAGAVADLWVLSQVPKSKGPGAPGDD
jgi:hypothetical protein